MHQTPRLAVDKRAHSLACLIGQCFVTTLGKNRTFPSVKKKKSPALHVRSHRRVYTLLDLANE